MEIKDFIGRLTEEMAKVGAIFNGVQIYNHMAVVEVCEARPIRYVVIKENPKFWLHNEEEANAVIRKVVSKFSDFHDIDSNYQTKFGTIPNAQGTVLEKSRYIDWLIADDMYQDREQDGYSKLRQEIDAIYGQGGL